MPDPHHWPRESIFTVGHSTLPIETFINLLRSHAITQLADVRTIPRSRHNPQFNADSLDISLAAAGITYLPMPGLGGLRRPRKDSPNTGWRNTSFRGYADYMQEPGFTAALETLIKAAARGPTAIMCAESVPWRCHRSLVADALEARSIPVIEILSATSHRRHKLTPFAQITGTQVTYPPAQQSLI